MATYSFNIKQQPVTKYGKKLNAATHLDYIDRNGSYKNREDLIASGSDNLPDWAPTARHYWEAASMYERANGNAYREITWALPSELSDTVNEELVQEFCQETFGEKFTYSYAIHSKPSSDPEHDNVHVHIMFNERELDPNRVYDNPEWHFARYTEVDGIEVGYRKHIEFREKKTLYQLRERAADLTNKYYEGFLMEERVDHRSFKNQKAALEAEGRFSEAEKLNVEPKKRIPAAQYYKEQREIRQTLKPEEQINKAHNELANEIRKEKEALFKKYHDQLIVYAVNLKDYFGDLRYEANQQVKALEKQIQELRKEKVSDKAIETWAKNQIVKGYSKKAKSLKSTIEISTYKFEKGMLSGEGFVKLQEAKKELEKLEASIPPDALEQRKQAIIQRNQEIEEKIKPLYAAMKPLQSKVKKYDRILGQLKKIPNDAVIGVIKQGGIIINKNSIKNHIAGKNTSDMQTISGKIVNANQPRPKEKSYATSPKKSHMVASIAKNIERKIDSMVISNEGGFVATKELTAEDIQEMAHHGQEL